MKPLNRAERTNAFVRFLLLFAITVALIITVLFLSIQLPFKENDRLRQTMARMKDDKDASETFNITVREAVDELNKFDAKKEQPAIVTRQQVNLVIERLSRQLKNLPNGENSINALIVQNLDALNKAKYSLNSKPE